MAEVETRCGCYRSTGGPSVAHQVLSESKGATVFTRIISFATRRPKRVIALWAVVAVALAGISGLVGYKVVTDDTTRFLPEDAESAQAAKYAEDRFGEQPGSRTVVALIKRADERPLDAADRTEVQALATALPRWPFDASRPAVEGLPGDLGERAGRIVAAEAGPVAPDGRFALIGLQWKADATDPVAQEAFRQLRDRAAGAARVDGLRIGFTGSVATMADFEEASTGMKSLSQALLFG